MAKRETIAQEIARLRAENARLAQGKPVLDSKDRLEIRERQRRARENQQSSANANDWNAMLALLAQRQDILSKR